MGGAANCPETPRQKMIGMMYLFLTAMLALNVSKDILNAFVVVNKGLESTNANFENKNSATMGAISFAYTNDKTKVKPTYDAAEQVQVKAKEIIEYIDNLKKEVINLTAGQEDLQSMYGDTVQLINIGVKDNYDAPTRYFMGGSTTDGEETAEVVGGKAPELKVKLDGFVAELKALLIGVNVKGVEQLGDFGVDTQDPEEKDMESPEENYWASSKFYHLPLAANIAILSQIQNQVRNAEATALNKLLGNIGATDMKFDNLEARVIPKSTYVIQGADYEADLFVAAWSSTTNPEVIVGPASQLDTVTKQFKSGADTTHVKVIDGVGKYKIQANSLGEQKYAAVLNVKNTSTGEITPYSLKVDDNYFASYMVAKPAAVISPTKMNVFYIGVDNPVSISVPGFAAEKIMPGIARGSGVRIIPKNKAKGEYIVKVSKRGTVSIRVTATDDNGNKTSFPPQEFRIKKVPDPIAQIAGVSSGSIPMSKIKMASGMKAEMENFDFEMSSIITGFTLSANIGGYEQSKKSRSYKFTPDQKALLNKVKRNSRVTFENISAKVAGSTRKLRDMSLKLN